MAIDWVPLWPSLRVAAVSTAIAVTLGLWIAWHWIINRLAGENTAFVVASEGRLAIGRRFPTCPTCGGA